MPAGHLRAAETLVGLEELMDGEQTLATVIDGYKPDDAGSRDASAASDSFGHRWRTASSRAVH